MTLPILQTKLYIPPLQPTWVLRQRLIDRLNGAAGCKLILVSAPAGFGKSTLVTAWLRQLDRRVTWLALDELDDEPERFWQYFLAALAQAEPEIAEAAIDLLISSEARSIRAVLALLVNRLAGLTTPLVCVVDDYHQITNAAIHTDLAFLLDHLPTQMQLVLISRTDPPLPLPRLRARGQVLEVRPPDLRFTLVEASAFLQGRMALDLEPSAVALLEERTEGWVAALQFAALSLQGLRQPAEAQRFIQQLSGRDRHVVDYLMAEVLERQPPAVQHFLTQTAILERLCAPLCDSVLETTDSQTMLHHLDRTNLFLVSLDNERYWYRYHHLFGEFLRQRLYQQHQASTCQLLHQRASQWCKSNGFLDNAIDHALAGQDYERAAQLLELVAGDTLWLRGAVQRLRRWIEALPPATLMAHPQLAFEGYIAQLATYNFPRAEEYRRLLSQAPNVSEELQVKLMAIGSSLTRVQGNIAQAQETLRQALALAPEESHETQLTIKLQMAVLLLEIDDLVGSRQLFHETVELARLANRPHLLVHGFTFLGIISQEQGDLHRAEQLYREALSIAQRQGGEFYAASGLARGCLAGLLYEWNDVTSATEQLQKAIALGEMTEMGDILWQGYQLQAEVAHQQNDQATVRLMVEKAHQLWERIKEPTLASAVKVFYNDFAAKAALWEDDLAAVRHWLASRKLQPAGPTARNWEAYSVWVRFLLRQNQLDQDAAALEQASALLGYLQEQAAQKGLVQIEVRLTVLLALVYQQQARPMDALHALGKALRLAEPDGFIRTFVGQGEPLRLLLEGALAQGITPAYTRTLLAALAAEEASHRSIPLPAVTPPATNGSQLAQPLIEPLTEREREVLALVAAGLTNQAIADRLVISPPTVKRHISNIYGKLAVTHRTEALVRARALGLVG